ncbi:MAG: GNAT family N-acetyltransferase [Acidimicrobiia bacterium]|nr:GNAT family N-acetyltransferase [Acidimicrobiia bacterium]
MVPCTIDDSYHVRLYAPASDRGSIPVTFGAAFGEAPWPHDWDHFDEFDPNGVYVVERGTMIVGFAISFRRQECGYVSVVAVIPGHRRKGLATALICACASRFSSQQLREIRIDAFEDSPAAVECYRALGFEIIERIPDPESKEHAP